MLFGVTHISIAIRWCDCRFLDEEVVGDGQEAARSQTRAKPINTTHILKDDDNDDEEEEEEEEEDIPHRMTITHQERKQE